uniref:Uncharacterized protein n=1 Tax=Peronospora matthiolae TaxID=2874970 RepID=A0AAV1U7Y8_9STRA
MVKAALVKCDSGWFHAEAWLGRELNTLKIEGSIPSSDI